LTQRFSLSLNKTGTRENAAAAVAKRKKVGFLSYIRRKNLQLERHLKTGRVDPHLDSHKG